MWSVDLALQDEELMAQSEDFSVTGVACREYPFESVENKVNQSGNQGHERRRLRVRAMAKTRWFTARMNLRHAQARRRVDPATQQSRFRTTNFSTLLVIWVRDGDHREFLDSSEVPGVACV